LKIAIRPVTEDDAPAIQAIYAPVVTDTAISFEEVPPSVAETALRIAEKLAAFPYLVAASDDRVVGYAYGGPLRDRSAYRFAVEGTIYVSPDAQRGGVGRMLYGALLSELRRRGFHAAFAGVALPNAASVALHEAMGFTPVGVYREVGFKFGRWHYVGWWQRLL
jgi:phosphinothricin acetyltransferase